MLVMPMYPIYARGIRMGFNSDLYGALTMNSRVRPVGVRRPCVLRFHPFVSSRFELVENRIETSLGALSICHLDKLDGYSG
jgi:hypothetical protein